MSNWDNFSTSNVPSGLAEDQRIIKDAEDYLIHRMEVFTKVATRFLVPNPTLDAAYLSNVRIGPIESVNMERVKQVLKYSYLKWNEHGGTRYGMVIVEETLIPRGYRITKWWNGNRIKDNQWISYQNALKGFY